MSGYPQNRLITLWRTGAELLVCHLLPLWCFPFPLLLRSGRLFLLPAADCHPLPVCRVRPVTGRASLSLRPGVVVILRHALASLRRVLQAAFAAYPGRRNNRRLRYSTVGVDPLPDATNRQRAAGNGIVVMPPAHPDCVRSFPCRTGVPTD